MNVLRGIGMPCVLTLVLCSAASAQSVFAHRDIKIDPGEQIVQPDEPDEQGETKQQTASFRLDELAWQAQLQRLGWREYGLETPEDPISITLANGEIITFEDESVLPLGDDYGVLQVTAIGESEPSLIFLSDDEIIGGTVHLNDRVYDLSAHTLPPLTISVFPQSGETNVNLVEQSHWAFVDELPSLVPNYEPENLGTATPSEFPAAVTAEPATAASSSEFASVAIAEPAADADIQLDEQVLESQGPVVIDLAVFYTPGMRDKVYRRRIRQKIEVMVARANLAYLISGINQELKLVHVRQVDYTPSNNIVTDLRRLARSGDGHMDEVFEHWERAGADVVSLWMDAGSGPGVAFVMDKDTVEHAPCAVSVVRWPDLDRNFSFEHELGHTMGARHDRQQDQKNTPYPFAHGYVKDVLVTIMGYPRKSCPEGAICERVMFFSNEPSDFGDENLADVRRTFNTTSSTVAQFSEHHEKLGKCRM